MQPPDRLSRRKRARQIVAARLERLEDLSIGKLVPSTLTLLALCSGVTAIRFGLSDEWATAVTFVICAMILDMLDGRAARLLGADSRFGAQLDSLADLVSFGIAPGVLVYMWTLYHAQGAGWAVALIFCACSAIRLARFNVESADQDSEPTGYFTGVPTPAAACLILLPMLLGFQFKGDAFNHPLISAAMIALTSWLMISRVPTLSLKRMHVPQRLKGPMAVLAVLLLGSAFMWPWATLTIGLIVYLASIPFGILAAAEMRRHPPEAES